MPALRTASMPFKSVWIIAACTVCMGVQQSTWAQATTSTAASDTPEKPKSIESKATESKVIAKTIEASPSWSKLSSAQQTALLPMQNDWTGLDANRKKKWLAVAQRYQSMSSVEQVRMHERMSQWASLTPAQRSAARDNYSAVLSSPNTTTGSAAGNSGEGVGKNNLAQQWEKYQSLSAEKKAALTKQAN